MLVLRRDPDSNRESKVYETPALPLGHRATHSIATQQDGDRNVKSTFFSGHPENLLSWIGRETKGTAARAAVPCKAISSNRPPTQRAHAKRIHVHLIHVHLHLTHHGSAHCNAPLPLCSLRDGLSIHSLTLPASPLREMQQKPPHAGGCAVVCTPKVQLCTPLVKSRMFSGSGTA